MLYITVASSLEHVYDIIVIAVGKSKVSRRELSVSVHKESRGSHYGGDGKSENLP